MSKILSLTLVDEVWRLWVYDGSALGVAGGRVSLANVGAPAVTKWWRSGSADLRTGETRSELCGCGCGWGNEWMS